MPALRDFIPVAWNFQQSGFDYFGMKISRRILLAAPFAATRLHASPSDALTRLMAGNARFAKSMAVHPGQTRDVRMALSKSQHPFATVLTCSDSRVAPELIFDQGLGDLFVVRVAGNILDDAVTGSIEYAVLHLKTPLVLVLGHERCGAVQAALSAGKPEAHVRSLVSAIGPAVHESRGQPGDAVDNAVRENVKLVVRQIRASYPILARSVSRGALEVRGGRYGLADGVVDLLE